MLGYIMYQQKGGLGTIPSDFAGSGLEVSAGEEAVGAWRRVQDRENSKNLWLGNERTWIFFSKKK